MSGDVIELSCEHCRPSVPQMNYTGRQEIDKVSELSAIEVKAHVPANDFELSKKFYQDVGFTLCWSSEGMALLHFGPCGDAAKPSFLLDKREFGEHLQMHLLVKDADQWWAHIQAQKIPERYDVDVGMPEDREWGLRDFTLIDPSGVLWRIGHTLDRPVMS